MWRLRLQLLCARLLLCASLLLLQLRQRGLRLLWLLPVQLLRPRVLPAQDLILQHTPQYVSDALDGDQYPTSKP